jgi:DNA modification methylase
MTCELHLGDCIEVMRSMPDNSVDAIVTDPPYELGFMGKSWDNTGIAYQVGLWQEVLRVLKPGGHLLSFGGTRTYHRMACAIEDAGFEIRDQIQWIYGSGFPKSLDIGKQDGCEDWQGWGTALKPANEPIVLARKPLIGTVARNVLEWGTGGLNIDGCRVGTEEIKERTSIEPKRISDGIYGDYNETMRFNGNGTSNCLGRFPANVIHDGSDEVVGMFPNETQRFFYSAKASRSERNAGLEGMDRKYLATMGDSIGKREHNESEPSAWTQNHHPTVKPIALMRYLCKLITPTGGVVLDPFMGSGTTGCAAVQEGFNFIGIEREREYYEIAEKRIDKAMEQMRLPNV